MSENFFKHLKKLREESPYTQQQMADKLDISIKQYQNYESKTIPPHEKLQKLNEILQVDLSKFIYQEKVPRETGSYSGWNKGGIIRESVVKEDVIHIDHIRPKPGFGKYDVKPESGTKSRTKNLTPVFSTKAAAGTAILFNDRPELVIEYVDIPFIGKADGVIEIVGDSMNPTYVNGTRIAVRKLEDKALVYPNECYFIIDANYDGRVKRLIKSEKKDHIILHSDNKEYPDVEFHWDKIIAVCKILCRIIKN